VDFVNINTTFHKTVLSSPFVLRKPIYESVCFQNMCVCVCVSLYT